MQLAFGVAATPALAQQDAAATAPLPTVPVTSDRLGTPNAETARKHPGARTVVHQRRLTESGARSLQHALLQVPGITVTDESGTGNLPNIGVRGLNPLRSEQVLLLQDGISMTLAPYGQTGASLFPLTMQTVEAIDIARGGAARLVLRRVGELARDILRSFMHAARDLAMGHAGAALLLH